MTDRDDRITRALLKQEIEDFLYYEADLLDEQKWSDGPELIQDQNVREHFLELLGQALVVESHGGKQIAAQRDSRTCCHHDGCNQRGRCPSWQGRIINTFDRVQTKKSDQVEDEVHQLCQSKQDARQASAGRWNFQFRMQDLVRLGGTPRLRSGQPR